SRKPVYWTLVQWTLVQCALVYREKSWKPKPETKDPYAHKPVASFARRHYATGHGLTFQMSAAYSAIVRSLENFPEPATFKIALRVQASESVYSWRSR